MPKSSRNSTTYRKPGRPAGTRPGEARDALLEAAQAIMAEKGMPRVTLREVADRAGVQPGLVNYYFGGKDGLLRAVVVAVSEQMRDRIERTVAGEAPPEERVREFVHGLVQALTAAPYAPRLMVEQVLFADPATIEEFVERFARPNLISLLALLSEGRQRGRLRAVEPKFTIPAMVGACLFFFMSSPIGRHLLDIDATNEELTREFADAAAEMILHGIAEPEIGAP